MRKMENDLFFKDPRKHQDIGSIGYYHNMLIQFVEHFLDNFLCLFYYLVLKRHKYDIL